MRQGHTAEDESRHAKRNITCCSENIMNEIRGIDTCQR
jgi:hypothetical protein